MTRSEHRRGARIAASFWIGVEGVDAQPRRRVGNLSATGLYYECEQEIGEAGSVQWIHIESSDHAKSVQLLARVVRTVSYTDIVQGSVIGVALDFLPESIPSRRELAELVHHVVELGLGEDAETEYAFAARVVAGEHDSSSTVRRLSVKQVTLDTQSALQVGDEVELIIDAPASDRPPFEGQVTRVRPLEGGGYRAEIVLTGVKRRARAKTEPRDIVEHAFSDLLTRAPAGQGARRDNLVGSLSRIKLTSLFALLDLEELTGDLEVVEPSGTSHVYLRSGRIIDAVADRGGSPKKVLAALVEATEGRFEFQLCPVDREDRFGLGTTALLIDLARESDEANR